MFPNDVGDLGRENNLKAFLRNVPAHYVFGIRVEDRLGGDNRENGRAASAAPPTRLRHGPAQRLASKLLGRLNPGAVEVAERLHLVVIHDRPSQIPAVDASARMQPLENVRPLQPVRPVTTKSGK